MVYEGHHRVAVSISVTAGFVSGNSIVSEIGVDNGLSAEESELVLRDETELTDFDREEVERCLDNGAYGCEESRIGCGDDQDGRANFGGGRSLRSRLALVRGETMVSDTNAFRDRST